MADRTNVDFFHRDCNACQRLWREYADATTTHIKLTGKQQIAALQHDHNGAASLKTQVADADRAAVLHEKPLRTTKPTQRLKTQASLLLPPVL